MSGIAGIIRFDGMPVEVEQIGKMTAAMAYRGPDGINHWVRGSVGIGQCMLRTTPESLEETQPLTNEDESLALVMDGRVDNWEELRRELLANGALLRNRSDAELVLRAYETWGRECLAHIDGDFAIVIWDERRREAFCARDRLGIKPFFYHWDGKALVFASDVHPILAMPWVRQIPNEGLMAEFMADEWYSRDETLWSGVLRLVAAHSMTVASRGPVCEQYWAPDLWATPPYRTDAEYIDHYRALLTDIVRRQSRSHRHVAFEVSGGLDSSAVFCIAENLRKSGQLPAPDIAGYTLDFSHDAAANELAYARAVGEHLGRPIQEIPPSVMDLSWYAQRTKVYQEFPGYPNGVMQVGLYSQVSAQGAKVLLTGLGADQFLHGSRAYYAEELVRGRWANLYECYKADSKVAGGAQALGWLIRRGALPLFPEVVKAVLRPLARTSGAKPSLGGYWLSSRMKEKLKERQSRSHKQWRKNIRCRGQTNLLEALYYPFDGVIWEHFNRLTANFGVEHRHPFLASEFVQFAFSTPERLRLRGDQDKYIHRQALQNVLPRMIIKRRSKAYFADPFARSLHPLKEYLTEGLPQRRDGWVDRDGVRRLFEAQLEKPEEGWHSWILWAMVGCDLCASLVEEWGVPAVDYKHDRDR
jgi:asparagine synthase (glutamine-hydrolysing)